MPDPIDPIALLQTLIRCRSVTPEDDGALAAVSSSLAGLGFQIHSLRFEEPGEAAIDNVFALLGTEGPHLCFIGHTDVVPTGPTDLWRHPPFDAVIEDGNMYGRGTADMKGGGAAFIAAVSRFLQERPTLKGSISVVMTGDEEAKSVNGTVKVVDWMRTNNHIPDVALVGEPSNTAEMGETLRVGRRGSLNGLLTAFGKQGHSAYPDRAENPIPILMHMLNKISSSYLDDGTDEFLPSHFVISALQTENKAPNVIPGQASALFNIRFNRLWTKDTLEEWLRDLLDSVKSPYDLKLWCNAECFITQDGPWRDLVSHAIKRTTGKWPIADTGGGTSDARFIAPYCPVVEYGLLNTTIHQINEHIALDDLENLTATYHEILKDYFA